MQINLIQNVLRKRTAQRYRQEPTTPVFAIYLVTTIMPRRTITRFKKSISGKTKWSLVTSFAKLRGSTSCLELIPKKLKVDIDCLTLGGVL